MIIHLETWEYEHASAVGIGRFTANWGKQDAEYYSRERMEDDRTAEVAAAITELAVAKYTNQYWPGTVWPAGQHNVYREMPDVGHNIEVRRVRTRPGGAVRRKQVGKGLELWVAKPIEPEFKSVEIWGGIRYDDGWRVGDPSGFSDDVRYVPRGVLSL
jgi:hypothetical protein